MFIWIICKLKVSSYFYKIYMKTIGLKYSIIAQISYFCNSWNKIQQNNKLIIVGSRFAAQTQDVWDLGPVSPVQ